MRLQQDTVNILIRNECETKHGTIKLNIRIFFETFIFCEIKKSRLVPTSRCCRVLIIRIDVSGGCLCGDSYRKVIWLQPAPDGFTSRQRRSTSDPAWWRWRAAGHTRLSVSLTDSVASPQLRLRSSLVTCWLSACMDPSGVPAARSRAQRRVVDCFFGQTARDNLCERTDRFNFT